VGGWTRGGTRDERLKEDRRVVGLSVEICTNNESGNAAEDSRQ